MSSVDFSRVSDIVETYESGGWVETNETRKDRERHRDSLLNQASVTEVLWVIKGLAHEERLRAHLPAVMGRLPLTVAVSSTDDTAHHLADVIEAIVNSAPTTISGKGNGAIQVAAQLFGRLEENDQGFKARLAHTVLQIAARHPMRFLWARESFSSFLREEDQELTESVVWELARLPEAEFSLAMIRPEHGLTAILAVTPPEALGAAQLRAISLGYFKSLPLLAQWSEAPAPWPVVEAAQELGDTDRAAFLRGLCEAVDRPEFSGREALKAVLRSVRPFVTQLEPRFIAEDRERDLAQRPAPAARPRYRS